jgi:oligoribonuclease
MTDPGDRLVWMDFETTGLNPRRDAILEVACLVTELDLTPVDAGISFVCSPDDLAGITMDEIVHAMHTQNGLLAEVARSEHDLDLVERRVREYVEWHCPTPRTVPLCGSSIAFDRGFLAEHMPDLEAHLHYRNVDVSSVKELARRWFPAAYSRLPVLASKHRAMPDVLASIAELRFYRSEVFSSPVAA